MYYLLCGVRSSLGNHIAVQQKAPSAACTGTAAMVERKTRSGLSLKALSALGYGACCKARHLVALACMCSNP